MLLVLLCLCVLYVAWTWYLRNCSSPDRPPYYPGIFPIIGHTLNLLGGPEGSFPLMQDISRECIKSGGVIRGVLGLQRYYVITNFQDLLTAANHCLDKHFTYSWATSWLGNSLAMSTGEIWKNQRRMVAPAFSLPILHGYLGVFNSQARLLVDNLSTQTESTVNILPLIKDVIFKMICMTVFGIGELDDKNMIKQYMKATDTVFSNLLKRFHNPLLYNDVIFKFSNLKRKVDKDIEVLSYMSDIIINKKRAAMAENNDSVNFENSKYKSLLDLLLELSDKNLVTYKEIKGQVDTFILAGYDTCSLVLTYLLICLGTYPDVQEKLHREIETVFGVSDRDVNKTDLSQLVYTEAVIKETLRVHSPGPLLLRYCDKEVQLRTCKIPPNTQLILSMYGMHRDLVWGADAEQFRPERWFEVTPEQNNAFGAFSLGKRLCPGQYFAMISLKTMVVHVIRHYRIKANIHTLKFQIDFLMVPKTDCDVVLERRNKV